MRRTPLPHELRGIAIRTARHGDYGLGRSRLRRGDVQHPFHGVSAVELDVATVRDRCIAFEPLLLPGQFFSHTTAALIYGTPLPAGTDRGLLEIAVIDPRTPPRGRGVAGHRVRDVNTVLRDGMPIASPADVWCQLAPILRREDLVAAGDHLVTGRRSGGTRLPALASIDQLQDAARRHRGKRGAKSLSWALVRVRSGVDSRPETLLRLLLVAGNLPEPDLDFEVEVEGGVVLHPDLSYARWKVAFEYEGDIHRTDAVLWRRDIERRELLETAGWRVVRVTSADIFGHPELFLARVRRILTARRAVAP